MLSQKEKLYKRILVIAAHPDDEVLGCGGTLALLSDQGAQIHVAFLSDGVFSRDENLGNEDSLTVRRKAAQTACDILGVKTVSFGDLPDNRMDSVGLLDIIKPIEALIVQYCPDTVFTHHAGDLNIDHRRTHEAVTTACRPQRGHPVRTLLSFEIPSSTEWQLPGSVPVFAPNWFVDISSSLERKLSAFNAYSDEVRAWPHPRSWQAIEHLARWRGAIMGAEAAEAYMLGRHLV